jgi:hypothetical protein
LCAHASTPEIPRAIKLRIISTCAKSRPQLAQNQHFRFKELKRAWNQHLQKTTIGSGRFVPSDDPERGNSRWGAYEEASGATEVRALVAQALLPVRGLERAAVPHEFFAKC